MKTCIVLIILFVFVLNCSINLLELDVKFGSLDEPGLPSSRLLWESWELVPDLLQDCYILSKLLKDMFLTKLPLLADLKDLSEFTCKVGEIFSPSL